MSNWTTWKPLTPSTVRRAPEKAGTYEIALDGRRHHYPEGWSSTIYYGMSRSNIRSRLDDHLGGGGDETVSRLLEQERGLKVRWKRTTADPRRAECSLLNRFENKFGSLPAGNDVGCSGEDS